MLLGVVAAAAVLTAAVFVLLPLVRPASTLQPLDRPRAGVRDLVGATADEREEPPAFPSGHRCPACGRAVDPTYDFCSLCLRPLR